MKVYNCSGCNRRLKRHKDGTARWISSGWRLVLKEGFTRWAEARVGARYCWPGEGCNKNRRKA